MTYDWTVHLPKPRSPRFRRAHEWAKERAKKYPSVAVTTGTRLRPEAVEEALGCYFMRIPFPTSDKTFWAFETSANRDRFLQHFTGHRLRGT